MNYTFTKLLPAFFITMGFLAITGSQVQGQIINTIAGTGAGSYSGDGGPATSAEIFEPEGVAADASYNVYIGDQLNNRVRKITGGIISTIAGTGVPGYSGDGGLATNAELHTTTGVSVDDSGNLYIADFENNAIRKVNGATQIITTIAGTGVAGFSGDGGPATAAQLRNPLNTAVDNAGNVYISDGYNYCIRKIAVGTGIITTYAGKGGGYGFSGDGGPATAAEMTNPWGLCVDDSDNVYITDTYNDRIRKINGSTGIITTVVGDGAGGYSGDGGPAIDAEIYLPTMVCLDASGNLYIADFGNYVIREVNKSTGIITTVAGDHTYGFSGDGGPATNAQMAEPWGVAVDPSANIYIGDDFNNRVREVTVPVFITVKVSPDPVTICSGSGVMLTASGAITYTWSPSTGLSATSGSSVIADPAITTTYTVHGADTSSHTATASVVVTVTPIPPLTIIPQSPLVCNGAGVALSASGGTNYTWSPASTLSSSSGGTVIATTSVTAIYLVTGTDSAGCIATGTDTVKVLPDTLTIQPLSPTVCPGQGVALSVPVSGSSYIWSPASSLSASQGNIVIASPTVTTTYIVTGIDSLNCSVSALDTVYVSNAPNKPTILQSGNILTSSATQGDQWMRNDTTLQGATNQTYIAIIAGWYQVVAGNPANGCSTTSDSVYINPTGINQLTVESGQLTVYPNPTGGEINLNIGSSAMDVKDWSLQVTDVLGRTVYTKLSLDYNNDIDLSNLASGVYFICVINKTSRVVVPVVKQ